jgi:hypothetical protein
MRTRKNVRQTQQGWTVLTFDNGRALHFRTVDAGMLVQLPTGAVTVMGPDAFADYMHGVATLQLDK